MFFDGFDGVVRTGRIVSAVGGRQWGDVFLIKLYEFDHEFFHGRRPFCIR